MNEILKKAIQIVNEDFDKNKKTLKKDSVNAATCLNRAMLTVLNGNCNDCLALQVLNNRVIGCAAGADQIRKIARQKIDGDILTKCSLRTNIPAGVTIVKDGEKMIFSGSETFFRTI